MDSLRELSRRHPLSHRSRRRAARLADHAEVRSARAWHRLRRKAGRVEPAAAVAGGTWHLRDIMDYEHAATAGRARKWGSTSTTSRTLTASRPLTKITCRTAHG